MTNANRIVAVLKDCPGLDDDEIAARIGISRQTVNQECRLLASQGSLIRGPGGIRDKIINTLTDRDSISATPSAALEKSSSQLHTCSPAQIAAPTVIVAQENSETLQIGDRTFVQICEISPRRTPDGALQAIYPQARYRNIAGHRLNRYGAGPFCKFKIPNTHGRAGVYVLSVNKEPKYVGECENLASRYNMGYGNISPRNCFEGGQETNCRINNLIYDSISQHSVVKLWFLATPDYKNLENHLRATLRLPWNRA